MEKKLIMSKNGLTYFLLLWIISICSVTCSKACPTVISHGTLSAECIAVVGSTCSFSCEAGYKRNSLVTDLYCQNSAEWNVDLRSLCLGEDQLCPDKFPGGYIAGYCNRTLGESCAYYCNMGKLLANISLRYLHCQKDGQWDVDTNSLCVEPERFRSVTLVSFLLGLSFGMVIFIIAVVVGIILWSSRKSKRESSRYMGPSEDHDEGFANIRQQPNTNGVRSIASSEPPSYSDLYGHSFEQRIRTISSRCKYPEPLPSYNETQISPMESPPTYKEVVADTSRFNLYI